MRIIATSLLITLLSTFAWGQTEVILENNSIINKAYQIESQSYSPTQGQHTATPEKSICTEPEDGITSILAGSTSQIRLDIDTFNLGGNGAFECIDCGTLNFGSANIVIDADGLQTDSLLFTAMAGIEAGIDTLHIQYCNPDTCSEIQELIYLVRRPGRSYYPATINLDQEESTQTEATNNLPGTLTCSFFINCPDQRKPIQPRPQPAQPAGKSPPCRYVHPRG